MYMLDGGAPFRRDASGAVFDAAGERIKLLGDTLKVSLRQHAHCKVSTVAFVCSLIDGTVVISFRQHSSSLAGTNMHHDAGAHSLCTACMRNSSCCFRNNMMIVHLTTAGSAAAIVKSD
jgi:hypothetical protein